MGKKISMKYVKDTGMLLVLIFIVLGLIYDKKILFQLATIFILLDMTIPKVFTITAIIMMKFTEAMGTIVSRVILTLIWFLVVSPVALIRRYLHMNTMLCKSSINKGESVFVVRSGIVDRSDLTAPY